MTPTADSIEVSAQAVIAELSSRIAQLEVDAAHRRAALSQARTQHAPPASGA